MALALIWVGAFAAYAAFYCWYVGFKRRLTPEEVEACCREMEKHFSAERVAPFRTFLSRDTGREFYIANYIRLKKHTASGERGAVVMQRYQKPFLKSILKHACHPIAVGMAASPAMELWGIENGEHWHVAAFVRYRSRRDYMEILLMPHLYDVHRHKVDAMEKTIAFAADPAHLVGGGPKLTVPLALIALALLATLTLA